MTTSYLSPRTKVRGSAPGASAKTYSVNLACSNCGIEFAANIEKGNSVADYCARKCPNCKNANVLHKVAK